MDGIDDAMGPVILSMLPLELAKPPTRDVADLLGQVARFYGEQHDWSEFSPAQGLWPALRREEPARYVPVNPEKRLRTLEGEVARLSEAVRQLTLALRDRPIVYSSHIVDLDSEQFSLQRPIPIVVEDCDDEAIASFPETETFGSGGTPSEAIAELKRQIILLYDDLSTSDSEEFGKLPAAWWRILRYYIADR